MADLLQNLGLIFTEIFKWVLTVATTITNTPILLLTVGFLVAGGVVGIFGRLLSRG